MLEVVGGVIKLEWWGWLVLCCVLQLYEHKQLGLRRDPPALTCGVRVVGYGSWSLFGFGSVTVPVCSLG